MTLKLKLKNNELTVGTWLSLAHPGIAEIMVKAGFDWVTIDMEHSVITVREAEEMIRIIDLGGALSYNCQLVIRAATTVEVQGDATGTTLGGLGTAWTGGELIVNTPNVGLGLVYVGATDGANTTIASSDRGWRIVEV